MKKALNPFGLFDYVVTGSDAATEEAAAKELEKKLDYMDRLASIGPYPGLSQEISDARREIADRFGVRIKTTLD